MSRVGLAGARDGAFPSQPSSTPSAPVTLGRPRAAAGRQRSAGLARWRLGGLHRLRRGHREGPGRHRHLDGELGRNAAGAAHAGIGVGPRPRWSPDGRYVAFLSDRDDPREVEQVWLLDRRGGEPERITNLPGGVSDLAWSPDGRRLALVVSDPDPDAKAPGDSSTKAPKPIVLDRFQFKEDETGWLRELHDHLYLLDLATRATTLLLPGRVRRGDAVVVARRALDRLREPAPAGVRPHRQLRPLRRRGPCRRGAAPAHDLRGTGPGSRVGRPRARLEPGRQPDRLRAGRAAEADLLRRAEGGRGAGRRRPGARPDADARPERPLAHLLARRRVGAVPARGRPGLPPRARARGRRGRRADRAGRAGADGLLAGTRRPDRGGVEQHVVARRALRRRGRRAPADHAAERRLARERAAGCRWSRSPCGAGTAPRSTASWSSRPTTRPGRRYPTILRIHGGPVYQFYHEFGNFDWQVLAAAGYVVLAANPRGSSGRGEKFSTAIWAKWGQKDGRGRARGGGLGGAAGHRRSRPARRRRLELRRHPHQRGHRARPAVQGRHQRRGAGQRAAGLRHRPVREGVRGRARHAVEEPQGLHSRSRIRSSTRTGSPRRRCSSAATRT